MDYNYTLKYRPFEGLLADVKVDLRGFELEGKIDPETLIKVAMRVTYDLGLRVEKTKQHILEIEKRKAKLPDDFHVMNYAMICGSYTITQALPQGTNIEDVAPKYTAWPTENNCRQKVCLEWNENKPLLIQHIRTETRHYKILKEIRFVRLYFL